MMRRFAALNAIILLWLGLAGANAQQAIPATGGEATGSGGTVSYTVGQAVYTTSTDGDGSVAQGVQQPYDISEISGIDDAKGISLSVAAYPNPTTDLLMLRVEGYQSASLSYRLYDLGGRLLEGNALTGSETTISMGNRPQAMYLIRVLDGPKEIKTFRVVKR